MIAALVVLRICLQFGLQDAGVMVLRRRKPEMPRPFRLWLYPLPPLLALAGFPIHRSLAAELYEGVDFGRAGGGTGDSGVCGSASG